MRIGFNIKNLHKFIFYVFVFCIPINLGKHFVFMWSYVRGLLIDYLVPTVFFTDILVLLILVLWARELFVEKRLRKTFNANIGLRVVQFLILFISAVFLSALSTSNFYAALYAFLRLVLYAGLFLYVVNEFEFEKDFSVIVSILGFSVLALGTLAVFQWFKQTSVFNNYLMFGEQPYSISTKGIVIKDFFGFSKIPAYGTFRHPNILAGFLILVIIWLFSKKNYFFGSAVFLGVIALVLTLSLFSYAVFLLGLLYFILIKKLNRVGLPLSIIFTVAVVFALTLFPFFVSPKTFSKNPSVYRRYNFILATQKMIQQNPLFGLGPNSNAALIERYISYTNDIRFTQPVHNIFMLVFSESGLFAFLFFSLMFLYLLIGLYKKLHATSEQDQSVVSVFISLQLILLLGSFDHYFYTIHQTQQLFWLALGVAANILVDNKPIV